MSDTPSPPPEEPTESSVGVPGRLRTLAPLPVAIRRSRAAGLDAPVRSWAPVGTVDGGVIAEVDPSGLLVMHGRRWSLDWWIGAEDRWHLPSSDAAVRQHSLDGSPVLETALRVPGGDIVHRVGGVQAEAGEWSGPAVVVEVENLSAVPVALAFVVRPWRLDGPGTVESVALDGELVTVDGVPAALLSRPAARIAHGPTEQVAPDLAAGADAEAPATFTQHAVAGDLEVAFVLPLAHTATARVLLPAASPTPPPRRFLIGRPVAVPVPAAPWQAPELSSVASGWSIHAGSDPRVTAPISAWSDLVTWSGNMLRMAGPAEITRALDPESPAPVGPDSGRRVAAVAESLAGLSADEVQEAIASALAGAQRYSGAVVMADGSDAADGLLWSAAAAMLGSHGGRVAADLVGPVAKAIHHLHKRSTAARGVDGVGSLGCAAALRYAATALAANGQPEVAEDALSLAGDLDANAEESSDRPRLAAAPLSEVTSTLADALVERGLIEAGDASGLDRIARRLTERGLATVADALDAKGRPAGVLGFDIAELAGTRNALLGMLVADGPGGPLLLPSWPPEWAGREIEAHGLLTAWGSVSFALRWHGERPALLWDVTPTVGSTDGRSAPSVRVPGIDPEWSADGWSGDALLPAPTVAGGDSFT